MISFMLNNIVVAFHLKKKCIVIEDIYFGPGYDVQLLQCFLNRASYQCEIFDMSLLGPVLYRGHAGPSIKYYIKQGRLLQGVRH